VWLYHRFNLSHRDVEDLLAERGMRKFKSMHQAQRFLSAHAAVYNLFNLDRHLLPAEIYRYFRLRAFSTWEKVVAI
jgi:putative transposase